MTTTTNNLAGATADGLPAVGNPCDSALALRDRERRETRDLLGLEIRNLRTGLGLKNSLALAKKSGISPAAVRAIELGKSGCVGKVIRLARVLECGADVFVHLVGLWLAGHVVETADSDYVRSNFNLPNPGDQPQDARWAEARERAALRAKGLINLDDVTDAFAGESRAVRNKAAIAWWNSIHETQRALDGDVRLVWRYACMPNGSTVRDVMMFALGGRGQRCEPTSPAAWEYFISLCFDQLMSAANAYKAVKLEADRRHWRWTLAMHTARHRLTDLRNTFPERWR